MKIKTSTLTPILGLIALIIAGMVVPVGNTNDIYLNVMVEKPACLPLTDCFESAKIIDVSGYATPHTLIEAPYLADIISSGSLKIIVESGTKKTIKNIGTILKSTSGTYQITLKDVSKTQTTATVKLYENNILTDTKTVTIIEDE